MHPIPCKRPYSISVIYPLSIARTVCPLFDVTNLPVADDGVTAHPLLEWRTLAAAGAVREVLLAAADPSHVGGHASAALRNALLLAAARWGARVLRVVALRSRRGAPDAAASQLLSVTLPLIPEGAGQGLALILFVILTEL